MVPFYQTDSLVDHGVGGVDTSYFPSLDLGRNLNLTADSMIHIRYQGISVDNKNDPVPENILDQVPQKVNPLNLKSKGIIFPSQSNNVHHTYVAKNKSHEEVMNMTKLELFLVLLPVDYIKE